MAIELGMSSLSLSDSGAGHDSGVSDSTESAKTSEISWRQSLPSLPIAFCGQTSKADSAAASSSLV